MEATVSSRPATGSRLDRARREPRMWPVALAALIITLLLQAARVLFPLLFDLGEEEGRFILAGGLAVAIFLLAPVLAAPLLGILGVRRGLVVSVALVVAFRLAVQVVHPVPIGLAAAATMAALTSLTVCLVALRSLGGDGIRAFTVGLVASLPFDAALRTAFLGWDHAWQEGPVPMVISIVLSAGLVVSALVVLPGLTPRREGSLRGLLPVCALGPFVALQMLYFQNLGFATSSTGLSFAPAAAMILLGDALALMVAMLLISRPVPGAFGSIGTLALIGIVYLLPEAAGPPAAILFLAGQVLAAGLVVRALDRPIGAAHRSGWRTSLVLGVSMLVFALVLVLYQIHYVVPLPVSNRYTPTLAAALLGLAAAGRGHRTTIEPIGRALRAAAFLLGLLVLPAVVFVTQPRISTLPARTGAFRIVDFNARLAVNVDGQVDPEATARAIERQDADVVILQEVGRGWLINGTFDLAEWLSRRLRMPYVFAPAADRQFGNAVFSRFPIVRAQRGSLPFGAGPQQRSFMLAQLEVGASHPVTVVSVHLQHREGTTTRRDQILSLLDVAAGQPATIVAGDMNMQPDQEDVTLFREAGFVSVQDEAGLGHVSTASRPKISPVDRVNWIFATPDLGFDDFVVVRTDASDHLPLAVTVTP